MAVAQANLDTLNTAIDAVKTALDTVIAAIAAGEELVYTLDTDHESGVGSPSVRILIEDETGQDGSRSAGNNAQMKENIYAMLNFGAFSSTDAA